MSTINRSTPADPARTMNSRVRRRLPSKKSAWMSARVGSPNITAPPDLVVDPSMAWRDERTGPLSDLNRYPVELHNADWEDLFDPEDDDDDLIGEGESLDSLLVDVDGLLGTPSKKKGPAKGARNEAPGGKLLPIFNPLYNVREVCKQLVLLEDHLFHPKKRCPDCIRKHLLTAEALSEEAVTLDKEGAYIAELAGLADQIRAISKMNVRGENRAQMAQAARALRKRLSKLSFDSVVDEGTSLEPKLSGSAAVAPVPQSPQIPPLQGGEPVIYAYRSGPENTIEGWYRGVVVPPGMDEMCGDFEVTKLPDAGWVAIKYADGCAWAMEDEVYPLASVNTRISTGFADAPAARRYWKGGSSVVKLDEQQAAMADLIQAVLVNDLRNVCAIAGVKAEGCDSRVVGRLVQAAVINALYESKLDPKAEGDKPDEPGAAGKSIGLFQLHENGAGRGMSAAQRRNPILNTQRIAREFVYRLTGEQPPWATRPHEKSAKLQQLIEREATGHLASTAWSPPSVGEWTDAWATEVERPSDPQVQGARRKRTADELFPPPAAPASAPVDLPPGPAMAQTSESHSPDAPAPTSARIPKAGPQAATTAVTVRKKTLAEYGLDPGEARAFRAAWRQDKVVSAQIQRAISSEDRALAIEKAQGMSPAARKVLVESAKEWKQLGLATHSVWPLARAVSLFMMAGAVPAAYGVYSAILERHGNSPWAPAARAEMAALERSHPRAYLASGDEDEMMSALATGALAFLGFLGMVALFV